MIVFTLLPSKNPNIALNDENKIWLKYYGGPDGNHNNMVQFYGPYSQSLGGLCGLLF